MTGKAIDFIGHTVKESGMIQPVVVYKKEDKYRNRKRDIQIEHVESKVYKAIQTQVNQTGDNGLSPKPSVSNSALTASAVQSDTTHPLSR